MDISIVQQVTNMINFVSGSPDIANVAMASWLLGIATSVIVLKLTTLVQRRTVRRRKYIIDFDA